MERVIPVTVRRKIASAKKDALYVCGNSDFTILFDFDSQWDADDFKTARFTYNGIYQDVVFEGNECPIPVISDTHSFRVGVFAGNLHTTTAAYVSCKKSILCEGGVPADPMPDVYEQIIQMLNEIAKNGVTSAQIEEALAEYLAKNPIDGINEEQLNQAVEAALEEAKKSGAFKGETGAQGPQGEQGPAGADGKDGAQGPKGDTGDDGKDGVSPTVEVSAITGGHRVTITDVNGTQSFDVADGKDGTGGGSGGTGADGEDGGYYTPNVDAAGNLTWSASKIGMPSVPAANIKGEQGIQGETGPAGADGKDGAQGPQGEQGPKGDKGDTGEQGPAGADGKDYVLNASDKQEIAELAAGMVDVPEAPSVELDTTLKVAGKAADAGAVGDALSELKEKNDAQDEALNALNEAIGNKLDASALPTAVNNALTEAKNSGDFKGDPGAPGEPGKDYVLTEDDKEEIAEMAAEKVEAPEGGSSDYKLVAFFELKEDAQYVVVNTDTNGAPLSINGGLTVQIYSVGASSNTGENYLKCCLNTTRITTPYLLDVRAGVRNKGSSTSIVFSYDSDGHTLLPRGVKVIDNVNYIPISEHQNISGMWYDRADQNGMSPQAKREITSLVFGAENANNILGIGTRIYIYA